MNWDLLEGDCLDLLRQVPDNSVGGCVTDPPAGISFMNREWDSDKGGRREWIAWMTEVLTEVRRVLKPGAYAFVWAIPRTSHWTATALEEAGFSIRHYVTHHHATGFPKSRKISDDFDRMAGVEPTVVGEKRVSRDFKDLSGGRYGDAEVASSDTVAAVTRPTSELGKKWEGYGTALKPASEFWILAEKPLSEKSFASNVERWEVGGLNIDACRVPRAEGDVPGWHESGAQGSGGYLGEDTFAIHDMTPEEIQARCGGKGRWPADVVFTHAPGCRPVGTQKVKGTADRVIKPGDMATWEVRGKRREEGYSIEGYTDQDGMETVEVWDCEEGCPVLEIDRQGGYSRSRRAVMGAGTESEGWGLHSRAPGVRGHDDAGFASRYFVTFPFEDPDDPVPPFIFVPKPSTAEKELGCESLPDRTLNRVNPGGLENDPRWKPVKRKNVHPTVKPVRLCRYFIRLIVPKGATIIDPFTGSGSVGVAAIQEGMNFLGMEKDPVSAEIARARVGNAAGNYQPTLF